MTRSHVTYLTKTSSRDRYISEVAPTEVRGSLTALQPICVAIGQFIACLIAGGFSSDPVNGWRWMLGLAAVPGVIQFVGFIFMPESPRWLVKVGREDEARKSKSYIVININ